MKKEELSAHDSELCERAREACGNSYAPFSNFRVGAAVRLRSGAILTAANQESEVLPAGMCAERIVLSWAQANHADDPVEALAVVSASGDRECSPCGICRQTLLDTQRRQLSPIKVLMCGEDSVSIVNSAEELLPYSFAL